MPCQVSVAWSTARLRDRDFPPRAVRAGLGVLSWFNDDHFEPGEEDKNWKQTAAKTGLPQSALKCQKPEQPERAQAGASSGTESSLKTLGGLVQCFANEGRTQLHCYVPSRLTSCPTR